MSYKWNLAENTFNIWDRLKICSFFLNFKNRWTQGVRVKELEIVAANFANSNYCVVVSSGSTANQLISQAVKDKLVKSSEWQTRNEVILSSLSWQTNASVWVREGFKPVFLDITMEDFCLDYKKLENYLKKNHNKVAAVFPTAILGFCCDIGKLQKLENKYSNIKFALDSCENSLSNYKDRNICSYFTSSTSGFVAHHFNCGGELGFIFTNSREEYEYFLLSRAHGLQRNLNPYLDILCLDRDSEDELSYKYGNSLVDDQFNFQTLSSNYRATDIAAFIALLDSKKWTKNKETRIKLANVFRDNLDPNKFLLPSNFRDGCQDIYFCLPLIVKGGKEMMFNEVIGKLNKLGIEQRPFISGNMLRQKPYQQFGDYKKLKNTEYIHKFARYIGLHTKVTEEQIKELCRELNSL